jgi:molybdenum cofactor biosynthesis protein B
VAVTAGLLCDHDLAGLLSQTGARGCSGRSKLTLRVTSSSSDSADQHKKAAATRGPVRIAIITVSDSRTPETDTNAHFLREAISGAGYIVTAYRLIRDEPLEVEAILDELAIKTDSQILLWNGGTGISPRDTTYDVLSRKLEKTLPGFGEIFRMLSFQEIGAAAMMSRATAGVYKGRVIISTPGSPNAVKLAWEKLILPEIAHLAWEVSR